MPTPADRMRRSDAPAAGASPRLLRLLERDLPRRRRLSGRTGRTGSGARRRASRRRLVARSAPPRAGRAVARRRARRCGRAQPRGLARGARGARRCPAAAGLPAAARLRRPLLVDRAPARDRPRGLERGRRRDRDLGGRRAGAAEQLAHRDAARASQSARRLSGDHACRSRFPPCAGAGPDAGWRSSPIVASVVALVETRSFVGGAALALLALAGAARFERARHLVYGLALLGLALLVPRAAAIVRGEDSSASARAGLSARRVAGRRPSGPVTGWGPGSTPWTLAEHLRPLPGVNPPGEVVGEMHSLPLALAYELGFVGLALATAVAGLFFLRRWRGRGSAVDRGLVEAGLAGVAGFLLTALGGAQLSGHRIAARRGAGGGGGARRRGRIRRAPGAAAGALAAPSGRRRRFDGSAQLRSGSTSQRRSSSCCRSPALRRSTNAAAGLRDRGPQAAPLVARAQALDPEFPLYRARWAWSSDCSGRGAGRRGDRGRARRARRRRLWLRAGSLALEAGRADLAREAFAARAGARSAEWLRCVSAGDARDAGGVGVRTEASTARRERCWPNRASRRRAPGAGARRSAGGRLLRLEQWPGIDAGWRARCCKQAADAAPTSSAPGSPAVDEVDLAAQIDTTPALAVSLHLFRRTPWPADVARIRVERAGVRRMMKLPTAAALRGSSAEAFPRDRCAPR